ncbi:MAG: hypothetical protein LBN37_04495 [Bacteroidales bacterium]|nr:hypothetical protein [Bacteroidales bacterium]
MKRIVSIFLLLLMLAASAQPTLALHFCGGTLHSVHLGKNVPSCCKNAETTDGRNEAGTSQGILFQKTCCANYQIDIHTDTFQTQDAATDIVPLASCISCLLPAFMLPDTDSDSFAVRHIFPPDYRTVPPQADRLTQFCIFRI